MENFKMFLKCVGMFIVMTISLTIYIAFGMLWFLADGVIKGIDKFTTKFMTYCEKNGIEIQTYI